MIGVVFVEESLIVVSVIDDVDPVVLVLIGVLSSVERGVVSPSVVLDGSDIGVEDICIVITASVVVLINVASVKVSVLPVNAVDVSGYGRICTKNISVGLFVP